MRSIVLSNGELAVALDEHALVRDIYFPHVGQEDHVRGHYIHRVGVWIEGKMSWLGEDSGWEVSVSCEEEALSSLVTARHALLRVALSFKDLVYNEKAIFIRRVTISNDDERAREIRLYFGQQFEIYKSHGGDTAYFDPVTHSIIHYKAQRAFLVSASLDGEPFGDYAVGLFNFQGHEGTHKDAEDGTLSKNPIEHGQADSVIGLYGSYQPGQSRACHYVLAAGRSIAEVRDVYQYAEKKTPAHLLRSTTDYWRAWSNTAQWDFRDLSPEHVSLFKRSLLYLRAHVDKGGGIVASLDSDMLNHGLDTYSYVWPRDAGFAALALDAAGDTNVAKHFFEFCRKLPSDEGYFMHKYLPDGSLGSSWHPWIRDGRFQLPIQEDETALIVYALREHFRKSRDLEFLEDMFAPLVERPAEFMVRYRDQKTKLPEPSYDLWEEKRGACTYTAAVVFGALEAAAELSKVLGKDEHEGRYRAAGREVREGILAHLWDEKRGIFVKMLNRDADDALSADPTVDASSAYGVFLFGVLPPGDPKLVSAFEKSARTLSQGIPIGGLARYEGDRYCRSDEGATGNPWITTTLWYAEYLTERAQTRSDLEKVREIFSWVARHADSAGVLPEQMDPKTGKPVSATPLMWSHAAYVNAVLRYLDRFVALDS